MQKKTKLCVKMKPKTSVVVVQFVIFFNLTNCRMTKSIDSAICLKLGLVCIAVISITVLVDLVLVIDNSTSLGTFWLIKTQRSWIRRILIIVSKKEKENKLVRLSFWLTSFWWTHSVHSAKNLKSGLVWMFKILINFVCNKVRMFTHFSWTCWTL